MGRSPLLEIPNISVAAAAVETFRISRRALHPISPKNNGTEIDFGSV